MKQSVSESAVVSTFKRFCSEIMQGEIWAVSEAGSQSEQMSEKKI